MSNDAAVLCPFTQNQVDWLVKSFTSWLNVSEGGKRAGKNILEVQAFCAQLEDHPNKIHLVAGYSIATANLNVIDCDGLGVEYYFKGRSRRGVYDGRTCLYVQTKVGEKVLLISGGGKANDYKLIKGNTYGMAIITEANECHESFIKEVFDRTLSSGKRRIFHDLNPKPPKHKYYTDVLGFHEEKQESNVNYGYNYGHFTIADNLSISDEALKELLNTYDKKTVWYKRDIRGLRVVAEGLIYEQFANDADSYILKALPENSRGFIVTGIDFGGNKSGQAFNATLIDFSNKRMITISDYWNDEQMTPLKLQKEYAKFSDKVSDLFPAFKIVEGFADSAEQVLINGLKSELEMYGHGYTLQNSIKGVINQRIRAYIRLFALKAYYILESCDNTIDAFKTALWADTDDMEDVRLDDGTTNIDTIDAQEYSTEKYMKQFLKILDYGAKE